MSGLQHTRGGKSASCRKPGLMEPSNSLAHSKWDLRHRCALCGCMLKCRFVRSAIVRAGLKAPWDLPCRARTTQRPQTRGMMVLAHYGTSHLHRLCFFLTMYSRFSYAQAVLQSKATLWRMKRGLENLRVCPPKMGNAGRTLLGKKASTATQSTETKKTCTATSEDRNGNGCDHQKYLKRSGQRMAQWMSGHYGRNANTMKSCVKGRPKRRGDCNNGMHKDDQIVQASIELFGTKTVISEYSVPARPKGHSRHQPVWEFNGTGTTNGQECKILVHVALKVCPRLSETIIKCTGWPEDNDDDLNSATINKQCMAELCGPKQCPHGQILSSMRTHLMTKNQHCVAWFAKADAIQRIKFGFLRQYFSFGAIRVCYPWYLTGAEAYDSKAGCPANAHRRRGGSEDNFRGCGCGSKKFEARCDRRKCRSKDCYVTAVTNGSGKKTYANGKKALNMCYAPTKSVDSMLKKAKIPLSMQSRYKSKFAPDQTCPCDSNSQPFIHQGGRACGPPEVDPK